MADWQAIRRDYEAGESLRSIARKYGVSKTYLIEKRDKEQWNRPTTDRPPHVSLTPQKEPTTQDKQAAFLDAFAKTAIVLTSAQEAGISRRTVYEWLEHDEAFSLAFNQAKEDARDVLRAEIYRRAKEGWDEPVWGPTALKGTVRKYSDTLLIFHAKAMMPEYREKSQVDVNTYGGDMAAFRELVLSALAAYPEAKEALAERLMKKAGGHAQ
jgi:hypothetical protein